MSDDLNKKIKQITDILGQENLPDNVKGLLSLLSGKSNQNEPETHGQNDTSSYRNEPITSDYSIRSEHPVRSEQHHRSEAEENIEMLRKAKKVFERLNSKDDPRVNLLYSIKPFLNNSRQKKLVNCVKLLQMYNVTKYLEDSEKGLF